MKRYFFILLLSLVSISFADNGRGQVGSRALLSVYPLYQGWSVDHPDNGSQRFSEISTVMSLYWQATRNWSFSSWIAQADARGDLERINGISDAQISSVFHVASLNTMFTIKVNLPSGNTGFSNEQLLTSSIIGNSVFRFQVPTFGQGFNISPGIIWVRQFSDKIAIGLGTAYQYKHPYQPLTGLEEFNPGDEILLTGGMDIRLNSSTTLSGDIILTTYGKDKILTEEVFAAGNKINLILQFKKYFDFNELRILSLYRNQAKNNLVVVNNESKIIPNYFHFSVNYRMSLKKAFSINLLGESRFYGSADSDFSDGTLMSFGCMPEFMISSILRIPFRFTYQIGTFKNEMAIKGLEAGIGFSLLF